MVNCKSSPLKSKTALPVTVSVPIVKVNPLCVTPNARLCIASNLGFAKVVSENV